MNSGSIAPMPPSRIIMPKRAKSRGIADSPPAARGAPVRSTVMCAGASVPILDQMYLDSASAYGIPDAASITQPTRSVVGDM